MSADPSFADVDIGPLSWVKGEIDLALDRAAEALGEHAHTQGLGAALSAAQASLHQAHGALTVVGLAGISEFSQAIEQLLAGVVRGEIAWSNQVAEAALQGVAALRGYLDDLLDGSPNRPVKLFPVYRALLAARGSENVQASDLFFPDLSQRPPRREEEAEPVDAAMVSTRLKAARFGFQRGLLKWIRNDEGGLREMRNAVAMIELTQSQPATRALWWVALGALDALIAGGVAPDAAVKRLGSRLDAQIRKLLDGSSSVSERLMRDMLYLVAASTAVSEQIASVRYAYRLADLMPPPDSAPDRELRQRLRALREQLAQARTFWQQFSAGQAAALPPFHQCAAKLLSLGEPLRQVDLTRLLAAVANMANLLRKNPLAHDEHIALHVAIALLLAERQIGKLEDPGALADTEFAQQVDVVAGRLTALMRGETVAASELPALAELARRAQQDLALHHAAREVQAALATVEQGLDSFFRNPALSAELPKLGEPLRRIGAALSSLGQARAAAVVAECAAAIEGFAAPGYLAEPEAFEDVARKLSAVGLFTQQLRSGSADIDAILASAAPAPERAEETARLGASVESELAGRTELTRTLAGALRQAPHDQTLRTELRQNLQTLREDAQLVADAALEQKAAAAIAALETAQSVEHIEQAVAPLAAPAAPALPSAEAARLVAAPAEQVDAELLDIFLDEARDVLNAIAHSLPLAEAEPADQSRLTALRRGFHMLKGSGRMVGLAAFADAAWRVEGVLNDWLRAERSGTPALFALIRGAQAQFADWVVQLKAGSAASPDIAALIARCEQLRRGPAAAAAEAVADAAAATVEPPPAAPAPIIIGPLQILPPLFDTYLAEARSHLDLLRRELAAAAYQPPHPNMRRSAHTLASASATVGIFALHELAHALEETLERFASANATLAPAQHGVVAAAVDSLSDMMGAIADHRLPDHGDEFLGQLRGLAPVAAPPAAAAAAMAAEERRHSRLDDEIDPQLLPLFLDEAADLCADIANRLRAWRSTPADASQSEQVRRLLHTLKGSARMAGAMAVGELAHGIETRLERAIGGGPADELLDDVEASFDRALALIDGLRGYAATEAAAVAAEPGPAAAEEIDTGAGSRSVLRVPAEDIDRLANDGGEIALTRSRIENELAVLRNSLRDLTDNVLRLRSQLREVEIQAETQIQSRRVSSAEQHEDFDPLEMDRYTRLQELTRLMAESVNDVATVQHTLLRNLDHAEAALAAQARVNRELSQRLMGVRMVPLASVAERLHRVVRQTAKELDKRANLDLRGGRTEIDRSVLEKMLSPIEHLLRNAVAHGIEDRAARQAVGKPEQGEIVLSVARQGNEILIELSDDGGGLDFAAIGAEARRRGLPGDGTDDDEAHLAQLIFMPGFTTAATLSVISGRGIGMDVVRTETLSLGGRIEVESRRGSGTCFRIHLPVTLAVAPMLLVKSDARICAIPAAMVDQVQELKPETMAEVRSAGQMQWQGAAYAWHYLPRLLGDPAAEPPARHRHWLLLVRGGTQQIALEIDELTGNREVVVKNIGAQLARVTGITAAAVLDEGQIALILDPIALAGRAPLAPFAPGEAQVPGEAGRVPTVLVVDDSITVRKIASRQLERAGYRVLTAKDGVDALEQMRAVLPDVMLADIEMPHMDGFELARSVRADPRLRHLPIIMITSRIADRHRNHALEIGVDHYLGKPYDEQALLELVAGYIKRR